MLIRFFDIISNHIFKWKHAIHVQISGSCDQILFVGVLTRQLKPDQVTTVI